jgi:nucleoside-diphosphate-sugar epimerase
MKVSIIGLGWLGLQLAERFSQAGFEVKGTVRSTDKANTLNHLQVDISLYEFPNQAPDTVFEADALILTIPPGKIEDYLGMVWTLTEEIRLSPIRQVVFLSSVSVYPECNQNVDETFTGQPDSPQGKTLLEAEKILATKLCKCIKKIDPVNESKSIGICTKTIINRKGYTRGKFSCKKKTKINLMKMKNSTRKNRK